jgi:hypothetical protein
MTSDLDLELDLQRAAAVVDIPAGDVGAVVDRAQRRTRRRRRGVVAVSTVAALAIAATGVDLIGRDGGDDGTPLAVKSASGIHTGDAGIRWERVDPRSTLGFSTEPTASDPLYALSTAAGQANTGAAAVRQNVVWRSTDGVDWTAAATLGDDLYVSDLASNDGRIYAVGTGPATVRTGSGDETAGQLLVGWSDDQAKSWSKTQVPLDLRAIAQRASSVSFTQTDVAVGPKGVVAIAAVQADPDVAHLVPAGVTVAHGYAVTPTGIDVLGAGTACPTDAPALPDAMAQKIATANRERAVTPQEKDKAAAAGAAGLMPAPKGAERAYSSPCLDANGTARDATPQQVQGVDASYTWEQLGVDGDLLQAIEGVPFVFAAAPGSTDFHRVDVPAVRGVTSVAVRADGDGFDLVGTAKDAASDGPALVVLHSDDGNAWSETDARPQGVQWISGVGRVDGRIVVVGGTDDGGVVLVDNASGGWTSTRLRDLAGDVPDGAQVDVMSAAVGRFGVVVTVAVNPKPGADPSTRTERVDPTQYVLLASRDAQTFSQQKVSDLVPGDYVPASAYIAGDHAVVQLTEVNRAVDGKTAGHATLVGTPE